MGYRSVEQQREYQRRWIAARREEWIRENGPCASCGIWNSLEVDHIDPKKKLIAVSSLWGMAKTNPKRIAELAKCQVLCTDCHKGKTDLDFDHGIWKHGTLTGYTKYKCRCDECKAEWATYARVTRMLWPSDKIDYRKARRTDTAA